MADPQDLALASLLPALADDVYASAGARLRPHPRNSNVTCCIPPFPQAASPPRVDKEGQGLFCLAAVGLDGNGAQQLCWLVSQHSRRHIWPGHAGGWGWV